MLSTCFNSTITYACETWGPGSIAPVQSLHRTALKSILGVRNNIGTPLIHIDTGIPPIDNLIYSRQLKFWLKVKNNISLNPDSPYSKIYKIALDQNIPFIKHYEDLYIKYSNPFICNSEISKINMDNLKLKVSADNDVNSPSHTYRLINPSLSACNIYSNAYLPEHERILLSKYRLGSHYLPIETGRWTKPKTPQHLRLCNKCNSNEIGNLSHVIFDCEYTLCVRSNCTHLENFFENNESTTLLKFVDKNFTR